MEVKDIIKKRRRELGLTIADVAAACGVSEATVSRWESGHIANMRRSRIADLAKVLQISPSVIVGTEEKAPSYDIDPQWGDDAANIEYLQHDPKLLDQYIQLTRKSDTIGLLFDKVKDLSPKDVEKVLKIVELIDQENE